MLSLTQCTPLNTNFDLLMTFESASTHLIFQVQKENLRTFCTPSQEPKDPTQTVSFYKALAYGLALPLAKALGAQITGQYFSLTGVFFDTASLDLNNDHKQSLDLLIEDEDQGVLQSRLWGKADILQRVASVSCENSLLNHLPKYNAFLPLTKQTTIAGKTYAIEISNQVHSLPTRTPLMHTQIQTDVGLLSFYVPEETIRYFLNPLAQKFNPAAWSRFYPNFWKAACQSSFPEIFKGPMRLISCTQTFRKKTDWALVYLKHNNEKLPIYILDHQASAIYQICLEQGFKTVQNQQQTFPSKLPFPFSLEIGVTHLSQQDFQNLQEGDVMIFDQTTLSPQEDKAQIATLNLNDAFYKVVLGDDTCQVIHSVEHWI